MQPKSRKAIVDRDQGYQLEGLVEVDEGYVGDAEGKEYKSHEAETKSAVAVEHQEEDGRNRFRDLRPWQSPRSQRPKACRGLSKPRSKRVARS